METTWQKLGNSTGLLILRLGIGAYMLTHGWGKLQMLLSGAEFGDPIGLGGKVSLILIVFAEFVCAILIMAGFFTRLAAIPIIIGMAVAAFVAHGSDPWTAEEGYRVFIETKGGMPKSKEPALLFLFSFLALFFTGPGMFSIDGLVWKRWRKNTPPPH